MAERIFAVAITIAVVAFLWGEYLGATRERDRRYQRRRTRLEHTRQENTR